MRNMIRKSALLAGSVCLALGLSACGDDNDDDIFEIPDNGNNGGNGGDGGDTAFNVEPCLNQEIPGTGGTTVAGAVVPDTLTLNYAATSGFPNGRRLPDPVIDVTLAVVFLDLSTHSPATFANVPLNPPENDVAFRSGFPYLAAPQGSPPIAGGTGVNFAFDNSGDSAYARVDRMGMPAVSTALVPSEDKIAYNDGDPADDVAGLFVPSLTDKLTTLTNALADDLVALNLTPCARPS